MIKDIIKLAIRKGGRMRVGEMLTVDSTELIQDSGYQQKDRKPSQNDKTEHGMEKTVQNQGQSPKMTKSESIQKNQHTPSTSPPPITETTPNAEEHAPMPHESPLQSVQSLRRDEGSVSHNELMDLVTQSTNKVGRLENELTNTKKVYGSAITKLVKRVKKLEKQVKTRKARRRTKIVLSEDEAIEEDYSKQGRSLIEELDMDADFSLVPPHDAEIQEKISDDTEVLLKEEETTELIE
ncbi:hypothetical protein Tco_1386969 [Tanacetum coccineum]